MSKLKFRSFIEVCLLCDKNISKDQWIYIHDKNVKACRLQNYRNWSPHMIPKNGNLTPIGVEYFTSPSDKLWKMTDQELIVLAKNELVSIGLCDLRELRDGFVVREKYAYPLYLKNYLDALSKIKIILSEFKNLHVCGRGGLFQYIPMDLAIFTGVLVSRNIAAKSSIYDPWEINNKVKEYSHEVH